MLPLVGEFPYGRGKQGLVGSRDNLRGKYAIAGESPYSCRDFAKTW